MKTEIQEVNNRLFHLTIENIENRWFKKITIHEITKDGTRYKGKILVNDNDAIIEYLGGLK